MRLGILALLILATSCDYFTDQKVIVLDKKTKLPIDKVDVSIKGWKRTTDSLGFCEFRGVTGDLTKRPIEANKNGYRNFKIIIEFEDDYVTYKQKRDSTYKVDDSFAAMRDTLIIYLEKK